MKKIMIFVLSVVLAASAASRLKDIKLIFIHNADRETRSQVTEAPVLSIETTPAPPVQQVLPDATETPCAPFVDKQCAADRRFYIQ